MEITLPDHLLARLSQVAARQQQSIERILADRLFTALDDELDQLPTGEQTELRALHYLSDDVLQFIAAEQMRPDDQDLLTQLMDRNSQGTLSPAEREIFVALVERGDQLMLRKAETFAILVNRGSEEAPQKRVEPHA